MGSIWAYSNLATSVRYVVFLLGKSSARPPIKFNSTFGTPASKTTLICGY